MSKSLLLIGTGARVATVSTDSAAFLDLPARVGIRVAADTGPLTLRLEEFGDIVQNAWYAGSWTAAQLVAVVDVTDSARRRS